MNFEIEKLELRDLAISYPEVIPTLEKYHLDFSCHGELSLEKACDEQGIYTELIQKEITELIENKQGFLHLETWTTLEISRYIKKHIHSYFISTIPVLSRYIEIGCINFGKKFPNIYKIQKILSWIEDELDYQIKQEREILYPKLENSLDIPIDSLLAEMQLEFDDLSFGFTEIRKLIPSNLFQIINKKESQNIFNCLRELEQNTHLYLHLNKNILFPKINQEQKKS